MARLATLVLLVALIGGLASVHIRALVAEDKELIPEKENEDEFFDDYYNKTVKPQEARPNMVENPSFEVASKEDKSMPAEWSAIDGPWIDNLTIFWVKKPRNDDGTWGVDGKADPYDKKCVKIDTDVLRTDWHARRKELKEDRFAETWEKNLTKPPKYDTVAGVEGVGYTSDAIPVKKGKYYRFSVDLKGKMAGMFFPKVFILGYGKGVPTTHGELDPEEVRHRQTIHSYLACRTESRGKRWEHFTRTFYPFNPVIADQEQEGYADYIRIKLYPYWPPGVYFWDNARVVEISKEEYDLDARWRKWVDMQFDRGKWTDAGVAPGEIDKHIAAAVKEVERLTGFEFPAAEEGDKPVEVCFIDRPGIAPLIKSDLEGLNAKVKLYSDDMLSQSASIFAEVSINYYSPRGETLYIITPNWEEAVDIFKFRNVQFEKALPIILLREVARILAARRFLAFEMLAAAKDEADYVFRCAVFEGYAMYLARALALEGHSDIEKFYNRIRRVVEREHLFDKEHVYHVGPTFWEVVVKEKGPAFAETVFKDPPRSKEEFYAPERYIERVCGGDKLE